MNISVYFNMRQLNVSARTAFLVAMEAERNKRLGRTVKKEKD
ncbi:MAG: hypothetical protein VST71_06680 [Nitrospirota bacterium]|nr:hypothetical protein [Nitrospirota bacterium]